MERRIRKLVLDQLGGGSDAIRSAIDAAKYGANSGFHGFTYTREICGWVDAHQQELEEYANDWADGGGYASWFDLAGESVRFDSLDQAKEWLAWFVLEFVGQYYQGQVE